MDPIFFKGWGNIERIVIVGIASYLALIILIRVSGKHTLSKMNSFDLIITMALGSILGRIIISNDVPLADCLVATALLIFLQWLLSLLTYHSKSFRKLVTASPALVFHNGEFLRKTMRRERVREDEIRAAIEEKGIDDISRVEAVILGANGKFSVIYDYSQIERPRP
jgi:uncharacterized membrane protein YcaP (DUF421 family)